MTKARTNFSLNENLERSESWLKLIGYTCKPIFVLFSGYFLTSSWNQYNSNWIAPHTLRGHVMDNRPLPDIPDIPVRMHFSNKNDSNAVILNPSFSLALSRFLLFFVLADQLPPLFEFFYITYSSYINSEITTSHFFGFLCKL